MLPQGSWYKYAVSAVQKYRDDLAAAEAKRRQRRRVPVLERLKEDIEMIEVKKGQLSAWPFAEWIWSKWPPRTEGKPRVHDSDCWILSSFTKG
jgi:hypothetical protein